MLRQANLFCIVVWLSSSSGESNTGCIDEQICKEGGLMCGVVCCCWILQIHDLRCGGIRRTHFAYLESRMDYVFGWCIRSWGAGNSAQGDSSFKIFHKLQEL